MQLSQPVRAGYMLTEGRKIQKIPEDAPVIRWREFMELSRYCFYKNYRVERRAATIPPSSYTPAAPPAPPRASC